MKTYSLLSFLLLLSSCFVPNNSTGHEETPKGCSLSLEEAKTLADQAVKLEASDWGAIESTEYNEVSQVYEVYYPTSAEEASLLGKRGVDVDCSTGEVSFQPRD